MELGLRPRGRFLSASMCGSSTGARMPRKGRMAAGEGVRAVQAIRYGDRCLRPAPLCGNSRGRRCHTMKRMAKRPQIAKALIVWQAPWAGSCHTMGEEGRGKRVEGGGSREEGNPRARDPLASPLLQPSPLRRRLFLGPIVGQLEGGRLAHNGGMAPEPPGSPIRPLWVKLHGRIVDPQCTL
jgi:hypothetical protein